jgi:hypothetical protein
LLKERSVAQDQLAARKKTNHHQAENQLGPHKSCWKNAHVSLILSLCRIWGWGQSLPEPFIHVLWHISFDHRIPGRQLVFIYQWLRGAPFADKMLIGYARLGSAFKRHPANGIEASRHIDIMRPTPPLTGMCVALELQTRAGCQKPGKPRGSPGVGLERGRNRCRIH